MPAADSEELRKDVFAHYGAAMYYAQCIERSMMLIIMFLDHYPDAMAKTKSRKDWEIGIDVFWDQATKQTMGRLIGKLDQLDFPTDDLLKNLRAALKVRNFVAHQYFSERAVEITYDAGCRSMIHELQEYQSQFQEIEVEFNKVVDELALSYGLSDEIRKKLTEDLRNEHHQAR